MKAVGAIRPKYKPKRRLNRPIVRQTFVPSVAFFAVAVAAAWLFRQPLAIAAESFLIRTDAPEKADLIFVLGGDFLERAPKAAELYKEGYAAKILIAREPTTAAHTVNGLGGTINFTDATIDILKSKGVPQAATIDFEPGRGVSSTADEARALRLFVDAYPAHTVLVVTSRVHSRRARMALERALAGTGTEIRMVCVRYSDESTERWNHVKSEWTKLLYYFVIFWG